LEEFIAGDDGADSEPSPSPSKNIDDESVRKMIRILRPSPPPEVSKLAEPVQPTGKGKFKNKK